MNYSYPTLSPGSLARLIVALMLFCYPVFLQAQSCPESVPASISANPNTYYPGLNASLPAGSSSIELGAANGAAPIRTGDLLLVIQMQGAEIDPSNTDAYGKGFAGGSASGYLNNAGLLAGNMEYVVAVNDVPLSGGTVSLLNGTMNPYRNAAFDTQGQYRFQVIRVGFYHQLTLNGTLNAPAWDGSTGGVIVLKVVNDLNFNGQTISAAGAGFRGGGARQLSGASGGSNADFASMSTRNFNGSKGEGIAGTPRFINNNGSLLDNGSANEGYPGGSHAAGAPGNAGGGGTDGNPAANDENSGGGGGGNGGAGGKGGNSWNSNLSTGGEQGAIFSEKSPARLVMGGGGGSGTTNNGTGTPGSGFASSGAAGGGVVIIMAGSFSGTGSIDVSGANGYTTVGNDASGGGGAGGSVLMFAASGHSGISVNANGGNGGSNSGGGSPHGPGGGGGGGVIYSNEALHSASSAIGGIQGRTSDNKKYGAAAGFDGILDQQISFAQIPQHIVCTPLPGRFISANAAWQVKYIIVNWEMANEAAVKMYVVERSSDGRNFSQAGEVSPRHSTGGANAYSFKDFSAAGFTSQEQDIIYYRIKQISSDNSVLYSAVVSVKFRQQTGLEAPVVSPNPVSGATASIRFTARNTNREPIRFRMLSVNGVPVWQKQYVPVEGLNILPIDQLSSLPDGMYFIQYDDGGTVRSIKMVLRR